MEDLGRAGDAGAQLHYADPAYYDKTYRTRRRDVDYYVALAEASRGPVLEYGVGNGRVALAIAKRGIEVVGVDLSQAMVSSLRHRLKRESPEVRGRVRVRLGDMRVVSLSRRFPLVIAAFNTMLHLYDRRDVERFLSRVRRHLTPGGRFVFDISVPSADDLGADPSRRYGAPRVRHPGTGQLVRYAERFDYDPIRQLLLVHMEFRPEDGSRGWSTPLTHRQFFPQEIEALLHYNDFVEIRFTQDFCEAPAGPGADVLVVSCRARRGRRR